MPDPYVQKTLIIPYADGTPAAYLYVYIGSPSGTFSDAVKGDQYWFWDQSAVNYAAALIETSFHEYVPTVPDPTPGTAPASWFGAMFGGPTPVTGKSPYDNSYVPPKITAPFTPPKTPTYSQPNTSPAWWFDPVITAKPKPAVMFTAPAPTSSGGNGDGGVKPYLY